MLPDDMSTAVEGHGARPSSQAFPVSTVQYTAKPADVSVFFI
jgi:hypothetical protein